MRLFLLLLSISYYTIGMAQINKKDSTAQTIAYWKMNDKQQYYITHNIFQTTNTDTIHLNTRVKKIEVRIIDSTATFYTLHWREITKETDTIDFKKNSVYFKTDEKGIFKKVLTKKEKNKAFKITPIFYDEVEQFLYFHGGKYSLKNIAKLKSKIVKAIKESEQKINIEIKLTHIFPDENQYLVKMNSVENAGELDRKTTTSLNSVLDEKTGWPIYSIQTIDRIENKVNLLEKRVIELIQN